MVPTSYWSTIAARRNLWTSLLTTATPPTMPWGTPGAMPLVWQHATWTGMGERRSTSSTPTMLTQVGVHCSMPKTMHTHLHIIIMKYMRSRALRTKWIFLWHIKLKGLICAWMLKSSYVFDIVQRFQQVLEFRLCIMHYFCLVGRFHGNHSCYYTTFRDCTQGFFHTFSVTPNAWKYIGCSPCRSGNLLR